MRKNRRKKMLSRSRKSLSDEERERERRKNIRATHLTLHDAHGCCCAEEREREREREETEEKRERERERERQTLNGLSNRTLLSSTFKCLRRLRLSLHSLLARLSMSHRAAGLASPVAIVVYSGRRAI